MANLETETDFEDVVETAEAVEDVEVEETEEETVEESMDEETEEVSEDTVAAQSIKTHGVQGKADAMSHLMGYMSSMSKGDAVDFFHKVMGQFGPGKDYGAPDKSAHNQASIDMKTGKGPKTKDPMPKLKEDIEAARRSEFGRKLFEAFAAEYQTSYLNEKSETSKLLKVIDMKDKAMQEAAKAVVNAEKILESKQLEIRALKESQMRKEIMNELLKPLNSEQRLIMSELMESVKTSKLNESFEKYLPAVIAGKAPQKRQALVEAKEITGNKISTTNRSSDDSNIIDMRRLAGL